MTLSLSTTAASTRTARSPFGVDFRLKAERAERERGGYRLEGDGDANHSRGHWFVELSAYQICCPAGPQWVRKQVG